MGASSFHKEWPKPQHERENILCIPAASLYASRGNYRGSEVTGVCTSPNGKISASPTELLDPTLLHWSGITLILRSPLHSKLTFWNAKTEYGVELCSNHQRYGTPTPPNHHVEQSHTASCWQSLQVLQCWPFTKQFFGIKVKRVQFHLLGAGGASPIW